MVIIIYQKYALKLNEGHAYTRVANLSKYEKAKLNTEKACYVAFYNCLLYYIREALWITIKI